MLSRASDPTPPPLVEPARQPSVPDWLRSALAVGPDIAEAAEVLFFERFGAEMSGIVLLPESLESKLPNANRSLHRSLQAPPRPQGHGYVPPKRTKRPNIAPGQRSYGVERIDCREITLRLTSTRTSGWGVNLDLLKWDSDMDTSAESFLSWLAINGLDARHIVSSEARELLHAAFATALTAKKLKLKATAYPRLPLIHNQRCGVRYRLHFDKEKKGSPCDIHVLLYPAGRKPLLYGIPAFVRPTADERKSGLGILESWDKRVRFYQTTEAQWNEWVKTKIDFSAVPQDLRQLIVTGLDAARHLRRPDSADYDLP